MGQRYPSRFGRYVLLESIGGGAFGSVHFAVRDGGGELLVIKTLRESMLESEDAKRRFRHEAQISLRLTGDAFARVYEAGAVGRVPYLAMEYVRGCPLRKLLKRIKEKSAHLSLRETAHLADGVLAGVDRLHQARAASGDRLEIVHRDLSPSNLIVTPERRVRLIDLGVGRSALQEVQTQAGAIVGSPGYLSPEQVLAGAIDQRSDQFACAAILWELFSGERYVPRGQLAPVLAYTVKAPYRPLSLHRPAVPAALDEVLARGLAKSAEDRFASIAELQRALAPIFAAFDDEEEGTFSFAELFVASHSDAELAAIISRAGGKDLGPSEEPTVYATVVTGPERDDWSVSESMVEAVEPADTALRPPPPPSPRRQQPRARSTFVWPLLAVIAMGAALGFHLGTRPAPEIEAAPAPAPAAVRATSRPPAPEIEPKVAAEEPPPPVEVEVEEPVRVRRASPTRPRIEPTAEAPPPVAAVPDLEALVRRASRLRERRPQHRAALDAILGELALEGRRRDPDRLREIEARLRELE